jgi:hypothetical protein
MCCDIARARWPECIAAAQLIANTHTALLLATSELDVRPSEWAPQGALFGSLKAMTMGTASGRFALAAGTQEAAHARADRQ